VNDVKKEGNRVIMEWGIGGTFVIRKEKVLFTFFIKMKQYGTRKHRWRNENDGFVLPKARRVGF
jgi:hypothetical protein